MHPINPVIQGWHGKSLPDIYIFPPKDKRPKNLFKLLRLYYRTWFVHPLKRRMAKYYLLFLQTFFDIKVIAITGSSGKTSTKDMLRSILSLKAETISSYLNIDSTFNIPTTILKCTTKTKYLIIEMGVEYPGDMKFYRWLATPDIAVVTNIYQTHTLYFRDEKGVAEEKIGIVKNLPKNSFVVLNKENAHSGFVARKTQAKIVWFGKGGDVERSPKILLSFEGTEFLLKIDGQEEKVKIPHIGEHFVNNALAASAAAHVLGIPIELIKCGLLETTHPNQRLTSKKLNNGAIVLDDTYNNNPSAARATFSAVKEIKGKRKLIVVYGDMKELGETEVKRHKEIGKVIEDLGAYYVILVGPLSAHTQSSLKKTRNIRVETTEDVLPILKTLITKNSLILLKGARSLKLERVVENLI